MAGGKDARMILIHLSSPSSLPPSFSQPRNLQKLSEYCSEVFGTRRGYKCKTLTLPSLPSPPSLPPSPSQENLQKLSEYCDEFLVHGVDVEGMQVGILVRLCLKGERRGGGGWFLSFLLHFFN